MEYGIYAAVFILLLGIVALIAWGTRRGAGTERISALDKLDSGDPNAWSDTRRAELARPASERLLAPAIKSLSGVARGITPGGRIKKLERKIESAGRPWNLDVNGLLVIKLISLAVGLIVLVILAAFRWIPVVWFVVLALFVIVFTYYLPDLVIRSSAQTRKEDIARALPDFLDLLTVSVEAGLGLDSAMAKIAERPTRSAAGGDPHHAPSDPDGQGPSCGAARVRRPLRCGGSHQLHQRPHPVAATGSESGAGAARAVRDHPYHAAAAHRGSGSEGAGQDADPVDPRGGGIFPTMFVVILGPAAIRIYSVLMK